MTPCPPSQGNTESPPPYSIVLTSIKTFPDENTPLRTFVVDSPPIITR